LVKSLDDRRGNRIVPTAGAQRRYGAFVVAMGKAELVAGKLRMVKFRFGKIGHFGLIVLNPFVLSMNGTPLALRQAQGERAPFVLSLSKHERRPFRPFDKLRANVLKKRRHRVTAPPCAAESH